MGNCWRETLTNLTHAGEHAILVTRSTSQAGPGRLPNAEAARLVVGDQVVAGSVGEDLHEVALRIAQALLQAGATGLMRHNLPGITLIFEPVPPVRFQAAIFGGSAVARSTVRLLGDLPCRAEWYIEPGTDIPDSRPGNITIRVAVNLVDAVRSVTRGALLMIMTHDQSDDYALVAAALRRRDLSCVLLLGSLGKRERYVAQLAEEGLAAEAEARLICPIGITSGRRPAEIAIGAAARLLEASALPAALSAAHAA